MKRKLPVLALLTVVFLMIPFKGSSECKKVVKAKYQEETGWSQFQKVEMSFMSGQELNRRRGKFEYDSRSVYAVIFWKRDQGTVIDLNTSLECGTTVKCRCVEGIGGDLEGTDQNGMEWRVCVKDHCG